MKRKVFSMMLASSTLVMLEVCSVWAVSVTVRVKDSADNGVAGVKVRYGVGSTYTTWWFNGGTLTNASGEVTAELATGTYSFQAVYRNGHAEVIGQDVGADNIVDFRTCKLTLRLECCDSSTGIAGARARYGAGNTYTTRWFPDNPGTPTDAAGEVSGQVFPGTYSFEMQYAGTAESKIGQVIPAVDTTLTWEASKVTLQYSGRISYGGGSGDSRWFKSTLGGPPACMYLLPGTYIFHARTGGRFDLDVDACAVTKTIVLLRLKDHNGDPLAGGTARGGLGASHSTWHVAGSTDAMYGSLVDVRNGLQTGMSYEMKFNNTTEHKMQDVSVNSIFDFQTVPVTLRLQTCDGTPLDGGTSRYGTSAATTWFFPGGTTGSSAPGETIAEFFPGTYLFEMRYQATSQTHPDNPVVISGPQTLIWNTTTVTLNWPNSISYGGGSGDSTWFVKPSMELLPGTYSFHFRDPGGAVVSLDIDPDNNPCTVFGYTHGS